MKLFEQRRAFLSEVSAMMFEAAEHFHRIRYFCFAKPMRIIEADRDLFASRQP